MEEGHYHSDGDGESSSRVESSDSSPISPRKCIEVLPSGTSYTPKSLEESVVLIQKYIRGHIDYSNYHKKYTAYMHRDRVVQEIINTERSYVESMVYLIQRVIDPALNECILTNQQVSHIFGPIKDISKINSYFLGLLEENVNVQGTWKISIGKLFNEICLDLSIYSEYVNNYDNAMESLGTLRHNKNINNFIQTELSSARSKHKNIEDYLIMPVQRIPRYSLLLKELKKCTPEDHFDFKDLCFAIDGITAVGDEINKKKRELESITKISKIEHRIIFSGPSRPLKRPGCLLLKEEQLIGGINVWKGGEPIDILVLLFSDSLWVLRPTNDLLSFTENFHFLFAWNFSDGKLEFGLGEANGPVNEKYPSIRIQHDKAIFEMVFGDVKDQMLWYESLRTSEALTFNPSLPPICKTLSKPPKVRSKNVGKKFIDSLKSPKRRDDETTVNRLERKRSKSVDLKNKKRLSWNLKDKNKIEKEEIHPTTLKPEEPENELTKSKSKTPRDYLHDLKISIKEKKTTKIDDEAEEEGKSPTRISFKVEELPVTKRDRSRSIDLGNSKFTLARSTGTRDKPKSIQDKKSPAFMLKQHDIKMTSKNHSTDSLPVVNTMDIDRNPIIIENGVPHDLQDWSRKTRAHSLSYHDIMHSELKAVIELEGSTTNEEQFRFHTPNPLSQRSLNSNITTNHPESQGSLGSLEIVDNPLTPIERRRSKKVKELQKTRRISANLKDNLQKTLENHSFDDTHDEVLIIPIIPTTASQNQNPNPSAVLPTQNM